MNLYPILDRILVVEPTLVKGQTLFFYSMPPQVKRGVLVVAEESGARIDHELPKVYKNRLQVIVRDADFDPGYALAQKLSDGLDLRETALGSYHFYYLRPRHLPIPYRRGESDLMEFSVNFDAHFADIT